MTRYLTLALLALAACGGDAPAPPAPEPLPATPAVPPAHAAAPSAREIPAFVAVADGELTKTASGLQYKDWTVGTGESPAAGSMVQVEYTGWLTDGKLFDSSYKRPDSFRFPLGKGKVIPGWDEGVAGMKVGGKRRLVIPAELAYGSRERPNIPANSTLVFDVELLGIAPPRVAPEKPQTVSKLEKTETGLQYHDFVVGTGPTPQPGAKVKVDYTGWLKDGTRFDSSLERPHPISFELGKGMVIAGWDQGIATMKEGGKRQLVIPSELAYGDGGRPPVIPPKSTLIFEVELVDAGE